MTSRPAPRSGGRRSTTTSCGSARRRSRPRSIPVVRLYTHLQATDPDRFIVATVREAAGRADRRLRLGGDARAPVVPVDAVRPARVPGRRRRAVRCWPGSCRPTARRIRATATDSAQPISNALYARYGIVPRMPLLSLTGLPQRPEAFGTLPSGVIALPFDEIAAGPPDATATGCWSRLSTASIATCSASPTRSTTGSCGPSRVTAGSIADPTAHRSATATPARPAGSDRSRCSIRPCSARSSAT